MNYVIFFVSALMISYLFTPAVMKFAGIVGAIDIPKDGRRMHDSPIPLLGGLSIAMGFLTSLLFWLLLYWLGLADFNLADRQLVGLIFGILIVLAIGIIDDIKALGAKVRLVFQVIAALVVALAENKIQFITDPFSPSGIIFIPPFLSVIFTVLWIVGITNAVNLIDGLDGLAASVSLVSAVTLFIISLMRSDFTTAALLAALAGSIVGFLPRNFHPAKVFMGSSGAYFLGFVIAVISLMGSIKAYTAISLVLPILILGLPIFDTLFAIIRRVINGKSISESDRGHIHHRLISAGFTHLQSVLLLISVSVLLGIASILIVNKKPLNSLIVILITFVSIFVLVVYVYNRDRILSFLKNLFIRKEKNIQEADRKDENDE
jgi:UDP-GlcNAc:undecaprenyl-phosphate/decaprenyl-phosphate GlcNAc-1-phosphate transferase